MNKPKRRRKWTAEGASYLRGVRLNAEKIDHGGERDKASGKSCHLKTRERIAHECGVSARTNQNDGAFAASLDDLATDLGEDFKQNVLSRGSQYTRRDVLALSKADPDQRVEARQQFESGECKNVPQALREADRKVRAKLARPRFIDDDQGVIHKDFREVAKSIPESSVDLIFTDPPYLRTDLPIYDELGAVAARVLKPGGSLICYAGHFAVLDFGKRLEAHLRYWWMIVCLHTGPHSQMTEYAIRVNYKPLLWFVKGTRRKPRNFVDDLINSVREKTDHEWQQPTVAAEYYIQQLTDPGDLIFDPFCGSGTTAVAAKRHGRRWLTCDIDETSVILARKRLSEERTRDVDAA